jgi:hypothetical protein
MSLQSYHTSTNLGAARADATIAAAASAVDSILGAVNAAIASRDNSGGDDDSDNDADSTSTGASSNGSGSPRRDDSWSRLTPGEQLLRKLQLALRRIAILTHQGQGDEMAEAGDKRGGKGELRWSTIASAAASAAAATGSDTANTTPARTAHTGGGKGGSGGSATGGGRGGAGGGGTAIAVAYGSSSGREAAPHIRALKAQIASQQRQLEEYRLRCDALRVELLREQAALGRREEELEALRIAAGIGGVGIHRHHTHRGHRGHASRGDIPPPPLQAQSELFQRLWRRREQRFAKMLERVCQQCVRPCARVHLRARVSMIASPVAAITPRCRWDWPPMAHAAYLQNKPASPSLADGG